jgi:hypothetical protein
MAPFVLNIKALGLSIGNKPPPFLISTLGQLEQLSREFCHRSPAHFALNISEWRLEGEWLLIQMEVLSAHRDRCRDVGQKLTLEPSPHVRFVPRTDIDLIVRRHQQKKARLLGRAFIKSQMGPLLEEAKRALGPVAHQHIGGEWFLLERLLKASLLLPRRRTLVNHRHMTTTGPGG